MAAPSQALDDSRGRRPHARLRAGEASEGAGAHAPGRAHRLRIGRGSAQGSRQAHRRTHRRDCVECSGGCVGRRVARAGPEQPRGGAVMGAPTGPRTKCAPSGAASTWAWTTTRKRSSWRRRRGRFVVDRNWALLTRPTRHTRRWALCTFKPTAAAQRPGSRRRRPPRDEPSPATHPPRRCSDVRQRSSRDVPPPEMPNRRQPHTRCIPGLGTFQ